MWHLFLDESGDLGFDFAEKQPSRFLTITILAVSQPSDTDRIRYAVRKTLKRKVNLGKHRKCPALELKGVRTTIKVKDYFFRQVTDVDFGIYAITLDKQRISSDLVSSPGDRDRLYNFLARQVVDQIPFRVAPAPLVYLVVDRSKGKQGIAEFDAHIQTQLEGLLDPQTKIVIQHSNSQDDRGLSAVDLFSWGIFRARECADFEWYDCVRHKILFDEQYP